MSSTPGRIRKLEYSGYVTLASGKVARHPEGGRLPSPWTGVYVHNLSDNYVYLGIDHDAEPNRDYPLYDWDWRDFDGFVIQKVVTFFCASTARIYIMGYTEYDEVLSLSESVIDAGPDIAEDALVKDVQFFPHVDRPEPPPLDIDEEGM